MVDSALRSFVCFVRAFGDNEAGVSLVTEVAAAETRDEKLQLRQEK